MNVLTLYKWNFLKLISLLSNTNFINFFLKLLPNYSFLKNNYTIFLKFSATNNNSISFKYLGKFSRGKEKSSWKKLNDYYFDDETWYTRSRKQKSVYLRKRLIWIGACAMMNEHRNVSDVITIGPIRDISCIYLDISATCSRVLRHYDAGIWRARLGASGRFAFEAHATDVRRNRFIFSSRMNEIVPCYDTRFVPAFFTRIFYILQYNYIITRTRITF